MNQSTIKDLEIQLDQLKTRCDEMNNAMDSEIKHLRECIKQLAELQIRLIEHIQQYTR